MSKAHPPELKKFMDKKLALQINGGRQLSGILRGYDPFMNLVIDEAIEKKKTGEQQQIGMVVIRGNSIIMLEALDRIWRRSSSLDDDVPISSSLARHPDFDDSLCSGIFVRVALSLLPVGFVSAALAIVEDLSSSSATNEERALLYLIFIFSLLSFL